MLTYIIRRLLLMIPTLIGVTMIVFFVMANAPGGFSGSKLEGGGMSQGEDARRQQKLKERRYALDQPQIVQYLRWLNQVSPVGFTMASGVDWSEDDHEAVRVVLGDEAFVRREADLKPAVNLVLNMAGYRGETPEEVAMALRSRLADPSIEDALALAEMMDVSAEDFSAGTDRLGAQLDSLMARQPQAISEVAPEATSELDEQAVEEEAIQAPPPNLAAAQTRLIAEVSMEVAGRDRMLMNRFGVKPPDLGVSSREVAVLDMVKDAVPVTVMLNLMAIPIIYVVSVIMGVYAARHRGSLLDWGLGASTVALWSLPVMWVGMVLISHFASVDFPALKWFPAGGLHDPQASEMAYWPGPGGRGYLLDMLWHMVLPVVCMVYGGFAVMSKVMRGALLDSLSSDYIRTARAKGVSGRVVLWRHAFRNSLLPLITMVSGIIPALFAGSVIVETIFSLNGMGKLGFEAALGKDVNVLMGVLLIGALLKLTAEIIRDVCYAIADPRVSYE